MFKFNVNRLIRNGRGATAADYSVGAALIAVTLVGVSVAADTSIYNETHARIDSAVALTVKRQEPWHVANGPQSADMNFTGTTHLAAFEVEPTELIQL